MSFTGLAQAGKNYELILNESDFLGSTPALQLKVTLLHFARLSLTS
jgi:hypothetical protein